MCLPKNVTEEELVNRCSLVYNYSSDSRPEIYMEKLNVAWFVLIIGCVLVILYMMNFIIYYNYRFYKDGEPPFNVSNYCPRFIFPRFSNYKTKPILKEHKENENEELKDKSSIEYFLCPNDD